MTSVSRWLRRVRKSLPIVYPAIALASLNAQDSTAVRIAPVQVTVTREAARSTFDLPFALTRLTIDSTRLGTRRSSLTELLLFVPGVTAFNRFNPSQDPRLAVRGFGARSAFGVRGVRVLRDGIPLTLADGQTAIDFLDLETIGAAEVIRGSAGALYGNSSGGVVDFRTDPPPTSGAVGRVHAFYSDAAERLSAYGGTRLGAFGVQGTVTRNDGDGVRNYSRFRNTSGLGDVRWAVGGTRFQAQVSMYDSPLALNPGALTAVELQADPTKADPAQITKKSRKTVKHSVVSLQASRESERGSFSISLQDGTRSLENPQTFALVAFDRSQYGGSIRGQYNVREKGWRLRVAAGADLLSQSDERDNWTNCAGITGTRPSTCPGTGDRGSVTLDQRERVDGAGAYVRAEVFPVDAVSLTGTVRQDQTKFSVLDHRVPTSPEQSRTLSAATPMVGVNWRASALASIYANMSSSFETPTTTELANQPDGSGGLNRELKPQHGRTYELGAKGIWGGHLSYDAAVYRVTTHDELIPFEIPNGGGRRYFRNAGRTQRRGAELGVAATAGIAALGATGSWLKYTYDKFVVSGTSYNGNRVPGVSPTTVTGYVNLRPRWGLLSVETQHLAKVPADDANGNYAAAFTVVNVRAALEIGRRFGAEPVVGVDNIFDKTYAANVVTNASGGRFYEPGAGKVVWVGLRLMSER
jgi:iron complex outermembrane receptor protein